MSEWVAVLVYSGLAGAAIPAGGLVARSEHLRSKAARQELHHGMIAFGGGVLIAAVALVLVPQGVRGLTPATVTVAFLGGALAFFALDRLIEARGGSAAMLMAMVMDFVPEALALGAAFGAGSRTGGLLALLIGLQNLPEGFTSYCELKASGVGPSRSIPALGGLVVLGPLAALSGYAWLGTRPELVSGVMLFAAGGILYLTFQDIAPQSKLERHWAPALGAVLGFLLGLLGELWLAGGGRGG